MNNQSKQQAEDLENAGFHRFAQTLKELSDFYNREVEFNVGGTNQQ